MLQARRKVKVTEALATEWQEQLMQKQVDWKRNLGTVSKYLNVDQEDTLTNWSTYLQVWSRYVDDVNGRNRDDEMEEIVDVLRTKFDDHIVFRTLTSVDKDLATDALALKWQEQLMKKWVKSRHDLGEISKFLNVDHNQEDTLTNWNTYLHVWSKYVDDVNGRNCNDEMKAIVDVLRTKFDDHTVIKTLESMDTNLTTDALAMIWQEQMIKHWVKEKYKPKEVFTIMIRRGTDEKENLANFRKYKSVWDNYIEKYHESFLPQDKSD